MSRVSYQRLMVMVFLGTPSFASAQAVQLPTFRFSTVQTTVSVPDRGAMHLGGVGRASTASHSRGVPLLGKAPGVGRNRGIARSTSGSSISVHATIIDHAELDRQVLAEAARRRRAGGSRMVNRSGQRRAEFLSRNVGRSAAGLSTPESRSIVEKTPGIEELRRRSEAAQTKRELQAVAFYHKGRAALANEKRGAARVYFNMAARRASGELKLEVEDALADLSDMPSRSSVAASK